MMTLEEQDKNSAVLRLADAIHLCGESPNFDKEEIDHLDEILRIIDEEVPAEFFAGFRGFKGPDK